MSIAKHKPTSNPIAPTTPSIEPQNYRSIVYDDAGNVPLSSLTAYISGAPYYCTYYKQVVSKHNDLREIDPGSPNVYQQYERINDLEIRVSSPLQSSYDVDTGNSTVNGNGLIYPFMIPNIADYFTSDAGDVKLGLFRITNVERKTFNRDSAYYIEYEMVGYVDVLEALYADLTSKVIREYHFSKDRLIEGLQPILKSEDYQTIGNLHVLYKEILQYYFKTFFNKRYSTLVIPGQTYGIYDSHLVDYLFQTVDASDVYEMRFIKQLSVDNDPYMDQPQFWSILLDKDYDALSYCNRKMSLVNKRVFNPSGFIHGVYFSNVDYLVYPTNPDLTTLVRNNPIAKTASMEAIIEVTNVHGTVADLINNQYVGATSTFPYIRTVTEDDDYVLSAAFYDDTAQKSALEILVRDYLYQRPLDIPMLTAVASQYRRFGRVEQYYYLVILMTLIKEANRSTYT